MEAADTAAPSWASQNFSKVYKFSFHKEAKILEAEILDASFASEKILSLNFVRGTTPCLY